MTASAGASFSPFREAVDPQTACLNAPLHARTIKAWLHAVFESGVFVTLSARNPMMSFGATLHHSPVEACQRLERTTCQTRAG